MDKIKLQMFFCEKHKCNLLPKACMIRQIESNKITTFKRNPAYPMGLVNSRYSHCVGCEQGKELINSNKEMYKNIIEKRKEEIEIRKKGRPKGNTEEKLYKCLTCNESNPELFGKRRDRCLKCNRNYHNNWYANHKGIK